ncbi:hypothetical protein [Xylanibacter muris]|nr:hypothetical protein [Xylanibacter muris]
MYFIKRSGIVSAALLLCMSANAAAISDSTGVDNDEPVAVLNNTTRSTTTYIGFDNGYSQKVTDKITSRLRITKISTQGQEAEYVLDIALISYKRMPVKSKGKAVFYVGGKPLDIYNVGMYQDKADMNKYRRFPNRVSFRMPESQMKRLASGSITKIGFANNSGKIWNLTIRNNGFTQALVRALGMVGGFDSAVI